jgi:hypothetical protein
MRMVDLRERTFYKVRRQGSGQLKLNRKSNDSRRGAYVGGVGDQEAGLEGKRPNKKQGQPTLSPS